MDGGADNKVVSSLSLISEHTDNEEPRFSKHLAAI